MASHYCGKGSTRVTFTCHFRKVPPPCSVFPFLEAIMMHSAGRDKALMTCVVVVHTHIAGLPSPRGRLTSVSFVFKSTERWCTGTYFLLG